MKNAYILFTVLLLLVFFSFFMITNLQISSYIPRQIKDLSLYIQAQILANDSVNLAKFLLVEAKKQGKDCLNSILLKYPSQKDLIKIDFFYPLQECENFTFSNTNKDADLSKKIIILNIEVALNRVLEDSVTGVNEEILVNKKAVIYPNSNF